jgi:hypothetical protein
MASLRYQPPKKTFMKTRLFVSALLVLALGAFSSCDTGGENSDTTNYWTTNSLVRMQLRGSVHTMTKTVGQDVTVYTFNTDGNLTSEAITGLSSNSTTTYTYANGKLTSQSNGSSTTTFEYENTGKYIPQMPFHIYMAGLVPGLSAMINPNYRTDYIFHGSDLWMISSSQGIPNDTSVFQYTGSYPTSFTMYSDASNHSTLSMTYADNGMFKTYSENYVGPSYLENRVISFLADDVYQLEHQWVTTNTYQNETNTSTTNYSYNDHKDILEQSSETWATQWTDYVYDSTGNWTSRKTRYSTGETTWSAYTTETRSFTYY